MRIIKITFLIILGVLLLSLIVPVGYFVLPDLAKQPKDASPTLPTGFVTYVINLDRSKNRWEYILPNVQQLKFPVQRIQAVDGYKLTPTEIAQAVDLKTYQQLIDFPLRVGVVGCALSHMKAWQALLDSNYEFAIIFEDDVILPAEQVKAIAHSLAKNPKYWDVVNLVTDHRGLPLTIKNLHDDIRLVVYLSRTTNAGAYIINRHAAKQLLAKALPIVVPNDLYFSRGWELDLKYTGIEPRLKRQIFGGSTIMTSKKNNSEHHYTFKETLTQKLFVLQTAMARFMYNLWTFGKLRN